VRFFLILILALSLLWQGLSGMDKPLIWMLGGISVALTTLLAYRLSLLDGEGVPYARLPALLFYWVWLMGEIFKANWIVIKACLKADLDIEPALVKVKTRCKSDLAKTVFANSITLTPGTVSVAVEGDKILVHALYEDAAAPAAFDEMDMRSLAATDGIHAE